MNRTEERRIAKAWDYLPSSGKDGTFRIVAFESDEEFAQGLLSTIGEVRLEAVAASIVEDHNRSRERRATAQILEDAEAFKAEYGDAWTDHLDDYRATRRRVMNDDDAFRASDGHPACYAILNVSRGPVSQAERDRSMGIA